MSLDDFAGDRKADSRAWNVSSNQPLEDAENPFGILRFYANSVVADVELPELTFPVSRDVNTRRFLGSKLYRIGEQVLKQGSELHLVGEYFGHFIPRYGCARLLCHAVYIHQRPLQNSGGLRGFEARFVFTAGLRVGEDILEQLPHAAGAIHNKGNEVIRVCIELALVAAREQLGIVANRAQRLLQVVRDREREPLQFILRALKRLLQPLPLRRIASYFGKSGDTAGCVTNHSGGCFGPERRPTLPNQPVRAAGLTGDLGVPEFGFGRAALAVFVAIQHGVWHTEDLGCLIAEELLSTRIPRLNVPLWVKKIHGVLGCPLHDVPIKIWRGQVRVRHKLCTHHTCRCYYRGTMLRRNFILTAPAVLHAGTRRPWKEVERILARGASGGQLTVDDLPTPALLLDLDAFEANVTKMTNWCREHGKALRPHGKTHKCPEIALRLMKAGAGGACAAKLSEAEVFARAGVRNLLITTAVVGPHKIERAVRLASTHPDTIFCVDNVQNAQDLNEAAASAKRTLNVAIDLYVGGRTGIPTGQPAVSLAKALDGFRNLRFAGLQAYAGQASHKSGYKERVESSRSAMLPAVETRRSIEAGGVACPLLTGGSTGTYNIDSEIDGITELQPGSFVFMDVDYNRIGGQDGPVYRDFRNSLTVLTTIVSKPSDAEAVVDGGLKAFSTDKPFMPEVAGLWKGGRQAVNGLVFAWGGDEHGKLNLAKSSAPLNVGDRVEFVIPHCDPTVNLYDRIFCVRGERVEAAWPISARGMSQ